MLPLWCNILVKSSIIPGTTRFSKPNQLASYIYLDLQPPTVSSISFFSHNCRANPLTCVEEPVMHRTPTRHPEVQCSFRITKLISPLQNAIICRCRCQDYSVTIYVKITIFIKRVQMSSIPQISDEFIIHPFTHWIIT